MGSGKASYDSGYVIVGNLGITDNVVYGRESGSSAAPDVCVAVQLPQRRVSTKTILKPAVGRAADLTPLPDLLYLTQNHSAGWRDCFVISIPVIARMARLRPGLFHRVAAGGRIA